MLESKIEKDSVKAAEKLGWFSFKVVSPNFRGAPDRAFIKDGKTIYIEYKQQGKKPTQLQLKVHDIFANHGTTVHVSTSVEETLRILNDETN